MAVAVVRICPGSQQQLYGIQRGVVETAIPAMVYQRSVAPFIPGVDSGAGFQGKCCQFPLVEQKPCSRCSAVFLVCVLQKQPGGGGIVHIVDDGAVPFVSRQLPLPAELRLSPGICCMQPALTVCGLSHLENPPEFPAPAAPVPVWYRHTTRRIVIGIPTSLFADSGLAHNLEHGLGERGPVTQLHIGIISPNHHSSEFLLFHPPAFFGDELRSVE